MVESKIKTLSKGIYRPEIDGIRALAISAVIINHFNKDILPSGYLGVDIFFVISGYVITSSLAGRKSKNFVDFITSFYERRIKRLVPALVAFVLITSILISLFIPDPESYFNNGIASLFGLSNLYLLKQSTDYFAQATELNVFTHTWSLGVEEQFYFVFPFIIWFTGFGSKTHKAARNLFLTVLFLIIFSLICFVYLYSKYQPAAYFLMPARFWEMATGCLVFLIIQKKGIIGKKLEKTPPLLILFLMLGIMFLPISFAVISTVSIVILTALLIICLRKGTMIFTLLSKEKVVYIGLISYSLYLWHWGILSLSRWTIGIHWWSIPFQVTIIFILAITSYRWIEMPFRKNKYTSTERIFICAVASIITSSTTILFFGKYIKPHVYLGDSDTLYKSNTIKEGLTNYHCDFRYQNIFKEKTAIEDCNFRSLSKNKDEITNNKQNIYFVGSSHAGTLAGLIGRFSDQTKANLYSLYVGATFFPSLNESFFPAEMQEAPRNYNFNQEKIESFIKKDSYKKDIIVISNHLELLVNNSKRSRKENKIMVEKYFENLNKFTDHMNEKGVNVVLVGPMPYFDELEKSGMVNTAHCFPQWFKQNPTNCLYSTSRENLENSNKILISYSNQWSANFPNGFLFEPFDYFCPQNQEKCRNEIYGMIYMYDKDHLNTHGGQILSVPFMNFLKSKNLISYQ